MTEIAHPFPGFCASPFGGAGGGVAGVSLPPETQGWGSVEGAGSRLFRARQGNVSHGILSGRTDEGWAPEALHWYLAMCQSLAIRAQGQWLDYHEWPIPLLAAARNPRRARDAAAAAREQRAALAMEIYGYESGLTFSRALRAVEEDWITHSNGGVIALQALRRRRAERLRVHCLVMVAPALRTRSASRELGEMLREGTLGRVVLVRCLEDRALGFASRRRLATWPWGSLGIDGFDLDALGEVPAGSAATVDLPGARHSDPLAPAQRQGTFREIFAPALGFAPWPEHFDGATWEGGLA